MRRAATRVLLLVVGLGVSQCVLSSAATDAWAQSGGDPKKKSDALLKEGEALAKSGKTEPALAKFEEAYSLSPTGVAAFHVARMEQLLGRHALALQHFREALRDSALPLDPRRESEKSIEDLKTKIGVITLDVPPGATTTVDGNEVDVKSSIEVVPGLHVVKIKLSGETKSLDVTAPAGVVTPVKIRFDEPAKPPPGGTDVVVPPPKETTTKWPTAKTVVVIGGGAVAVGLLATSAVMFAVAGVDKPTDASLCTVQSPPSVCSQLREDRDAYDSNRSTSTVLFYSGVAMAALTGAAILLWPNEKVVVGASFSPSRLGEGGVGELRVRF